TWLLCCLRLIDRVDPGLLPAPLLLLLLRWSLCLLSWLLLLWGLLRLLLKLLRATTREMSRLLAKVTDVLSSTTLSPVKSTTSWARWNLSL
ncbi:Unknown protein, partial [Striga hermonthica]